MVPFCCAIPTRTWLIFVGIVKHELISSVFQKAVVGRSIPAVLENTEGANNTLK